jgi:hypothetical protein
MTSSNTCFLVEINPEICGYVDEQLILLAQRYHFFQLPRMLREWQVINLYIMERIIKLGSMNWTPIFSYLERKNNFGESCLDMLMLVCLFTCVAVFI